MHTRSYQWLPGQGGDKYQSVGGGVTSKGERGQASHQGGRGAAQEGLARYVLIIYVFIERFPTFLLYHIHFQ